jgi:methionine synthase II (cobalamin-independent)
MYNAGEISGPRLRSVEDEAIKRVVVLQERAFLQSITDGEFRREAWFDGFVGPALGATGSDSDHSRTAISLMKNGTNFRSSCWT